MLRKIADILTYATRKLWRRYITFHTRPMFAEQVEYQGTENETDKQCAIIMQGPVKHEDDFTLETVKLYRRHYPSATIILSTWAGENVSKFEQLKSDRFAILQSEAPTARGPLNVNMQIVSTKAGVNEAVSRGFGYILKTRADQRMYGIDVFKFFQNLHAHFPVFESSQQHQRLVTFSTGTTKFRPYHFSDMFMFGVAKDIQTYWNIGLVTDPKLIPEDPKKFFVEGYLFKQFLHKTGWTPKDTLEDSLQAMGKRCVVIDNESIDVYWPKHSTHREYRVRNYTRPTFEITFKVWFNEAFMPALKK